MMKKTYIQPVMTSMTTECEEVLASSLNSNIGITNGGDATDHHIISADVNRSIWDMNF